MCVVCVVNRELWPTNGGLRPYQARARANSRGVESRDRCCANEPTGKQFFDLRDPDRNMNVAPSAMAWRTWGGLPAERSYRARVHGGVSVDASGRALRVT